MGGDSPAPTVQETTGQMLQAYEKNLPGFMKSVNTQILPNELAQLASSQATSPAYAALQAQILNTSGRDLNRIGNEIQRENQRYSVGTDLDTLNNGVMDLVSRSVDAAKLADPEYYKTRADLGSALQGLLATGEGLSGSGREEVARGLSRMNQSTGNANSNSQINTVDNAMAFGKAGQDRFNQILQNATAALPTLKSGMDANMIATGKQSLIQNTGDAKFIGAKQGAGEQAMGFGNNLLGQVGDTARQANQINANRRTGWDRTLGAVSSITGSIGNLGGAFSGFRGNN